MLPLFQSPGTSPDCHDFVNIMETGLAAKSAVPSRLMHLFGSHGLVQIQVPEVVVNLILRCEGLCSPSPYPAVHPFKSAGREVVIEDRGKRIVEYLNLPISCYQFPSIIYQWVAPSLTFFFWVAYVEKPFFCIPCQVQFQIRLGFFL